MIKFIESKSLNKDMLQFIVNLLYLGMMSGNSVWAQSRGTEQAVLNLLSTVSDGFIVTANDILLNGAIGITFDSRLRNQPKISKDIGGYQSIVDVLRAVEYEANFSRRCKSLLEKLTEVFSVHENSRLLK